MVNKVDSQIQGCVKQHDGAYGQTMDDETKQGIIRLLKLRQSFLLAIPLKAANVAHFEHDGDLVSLARIDKDLARVIKSMPDAAKESIEHFIHDIRMNSILASSDNPTNGMTKFRAQRYFYGLTFSLSHQALQEPERRTLRFNLLKPWVMRLFLSNIVRSTILFN
jgi:hypothetical protein